MARISCPETMATVSMIRGADFNRLVEASHSGSTQKKNNIPAADLFRPAGGVATSRNNVIFHQFQAFPAGRLNSQNCQLIFGCAHGIGITGESTLDPRPIGLGRGHQEKRRRRRRKRLIKYRKTVCTTHFTRWTASTYRHENTSEATKQVRLKYTAPFVK